MAFDLSMTCLATETAKKILNEVMGFRRIPKADETCNGLNCPHCFSVHLPRILSAVQTGKPVVFVLPAFPGKSPNLNKVLGALPDQAERLSLIFLQNLCERIQHYYSPGIKIILCSDGRVFSDVVGMKEEDVTAYQQELDRLIEELSLTDVSTFNLDDYYNGLGFIEMRDRLMDRYGKSLESLKERIRNEEEGNRMYCGIARFLFEDAVYPGQTKSRAAIQKESRSKAYEVIRRSNAWSELVEDHFSDAVRLSIHPQSCGSKKLGIRLIGNESWMTPWHGVAVDTVDGYVLLKRSEAENLGAQLVYSTDGRPSHYSMRGFA
jgi:pyoverdine/dityrosine biosynthesis protein Dit1